MQNVYRQHAGAETDKERIKQYFEDRPGEQLTAADLAETLGIAFWLCNQICEDLANEGRIK